MLAAWRCRRCARARPSRRRRCYPSPRTPLLAPVCARSPSPTLCGAVRNAGLLVAFLEATTAARFPAGRCWDSRRSTWCCRSCGSCSLTATGRGASCRKAWSWRPSRCGSEDERATRGHAVGARLLERFAGGATPGTCSPHDPEALCTMTLELMTDLVTVVTASRPRRTTARQSRSG
jgi:hypothetical protein